MPENRKVCGSTSLWPPPVTLPSTRRTHRDRKYLALTRLSSDSCIPSADEGARILAHYAKSPQCAGVDIIEKHWALTGDYYLTCDKCGETLR